MNRKLKGLSLAITLGFFWLAVQAAETVLFATVNGEDITAETYQRAVAAGAKGRFYHGTPPEQEVTAFRREVGRRLIEEILLLEEADRRGIKADRKWVDTQVEQFDEKYADDPKWQQEREALLPGVRKSFEARSRLRALLDEVEKIPPPTESELRSFYDANRELFTAPRQVRASTILLKVEPWAGADAWEAAHVEAKKLVKRLRAGASFEELARLHSQDASAEKGGDLGYIHDGMLGTTAQAVIDKLEVGQFSDPVQLLEGVAIFSLEEERAPRLSGFDEVRDRVAGLWERERRTAETEGLRQRLVTGADIKIHDAEFRRWWESTERKRSGSSPSVQ